MPQQSKIIYIKSDYRSEETYFIFRNNGQEVEFNIINGIITNEKPELTKEERDFFNLGKHKL